MASTSSFSLYIPAGTKVLARVGQSGSRVVVLQGDVNVAGARHTPEFGGGYVYAVGGREYYTAEGVGEVARKEQPAEDVWSHPHGLVTFRAP
jgi:hypothetical protein